MATLDDGSDDVEAVDTDQPGQPDPSPFNRMLASLDATPTYQDNIGEPCDDPTLEHSENSPNESGEPS